MNNFLRVLLITILAVAAISPCYAQPVPSTPWGSKTSSEKFLGIVYIDSTLHIPVMSDTPSVGSIYRAKRIGAMMVRAHAAEDTALYIFLGNSYKRVNEGIGSGPINDSVFIDITSSEPNTVTYHRLSGDSVRVIYDLGALTTPALDSIYNLIDSLFTYKLNSADTLGKYVNSVSSINDSTIRVQIGDSTIDLLIKGGVHPPDPYNGYTFKANNTNVSALPSNQTFRRVVQKEYTGTVTTNGTSPTGTSYHTMSWQQVAGVVTLVLTAHWASLGSGISVVTFTLPSECPNPETPPNASSANNYVGDGSGSFHNGGSTITTARCSMVINSSGDGFNIILAGSSGSYNYFTLTITYTTP